MIVDGIKTLGNLGSQYYEKGSMEAKLAESLANLIAATNTKELQGTSDLSRFLLDLEKPVDRTNGQQIPFKRYNVYFNPNGLNSDAPAFASYYDKWTLPKTYNQAVQVFKHTEEEEDEAKENGINLMAKDLEQIEEITKLYMNRYILFVRLLALVTGTSLSHNIPEKSDPEDASTQNITRAFGPLRGDDVTDIRHNTDGMTNADHYRALAGDVIEREDITDVIDLITSYDDWSGQKVTILAHPRTVEKLGGLYADTLNQDKFIIDGVMASDFLGAYWIKCPQMHKDLLIFVDGGKRKELILKCQNRDPEQRGLKLREEDSAEPYRATKGFSGAKLFLYAEEFHVLSRWSVAVLDIALAGNSDGTMTDASVEKVENWALQIEAMYSNVARKEAGIA